MIPESAYLATMNSSSLLRDEALRQLRPELGLDTDKAMAMETFQNETLRPILKWQHPLIIRQFTAFLRENKQDLASKNPDAQQSYISHALKTHKRLRATYFGLISGLMTEGEYEVYLTNRGEIHKRITQLLIQRLESHWL